MGKLIVHIGYPKTATTSLQYNFLTQLMRDGKIEYLNHLDKEREDLGDIHCNKTISAIMGLRQSADLESEAKGFKKIKKQISVISNENIVHVTEDFPIASHGKAATENAVKIKNLLSPYFDSTEIIMTIRAQETIIPSYYTQEYNNIISDEPKFGDAGTWFESNFGGHKATDNLLFNYHVMYRKCASLFGEHNVHVLVFEDLKSDEMIFYRQLGKIFNIDASAVKKKFEETKHNVTPKSENGGTETGRISLHQLSNSIINQLFENHRDKEWFQKSKNFVKIIAPVSQIDRIKVGKKNQIRELTDEELNWIHTRFDQSNKALFHALGTDFNKLKRYKYIN